MKTKIKWPVYTAIPAVLLVVFLVLYFGVKPVFFDRSGWRETDSDTVQYLDYYGRPVSGWQTIDGKRYYFMPPACQRYSGWLDTDDGRYYLDENGILQTGWVDKDDGRYYLDDNGILQTGWLDTDEG